MRIQKIKSINKNKEKTQCADMKVENNHNFFANNIAIHNCSYRGEIGVILINHGNTPYYVHRGDKIAQIVIKEVPRVKIIEVESLAETKRGTGGFGSTGKR